MFVWKSCSCFIVAINCQLSRKCLHSANANEWMLACAHTHRHFLCQVCKLQFHSPIQCRIEIQAFRIYLDCSSWANAYHNNFSFHRQRIANSEMRKDIQFHRNDNDESSKPTTIRFWARNRTFIRWQVTFERHFGVCHARAFSAKASDGSKGCWFI